MDNMKSVLGLKKLIQQFKRYISVMEEFKELLPPAPEELAVQDAQWEEFKDAINPDNIPKDEDGKPVWEPHTFLNDKWAIENDIASKPYVVIRITQGELWNGESEGTTLTLFPNREAAIQVLTRQLEHEFERGYIESREELELSVQAIREHGCTSYYDEERIYQMVPVFEWNGDINVLNWDYVKEE